MKERTHKFTKISIWIVLILTILGLVLPSILPLITSLTGGKTQREQQAEYIKKQLQDAVKIQSIDAKDSNNQSISVKTVQEASSSEAERDAAQEKLKIDAQNALQDLKKSSEEAGRTEDNTINPTASPENIPETIPAS